MTTYLLPPGAWLGGSGLHPPIAGKSMLHPPIAGKSMLHPPIAGKGMLHPPISGKGMLHPPISGGDPGPDGTPDEASALDRAARALTEAAPWRGDDPTWAYDGGIEALRARARERVRAAIVRPSDPRTGPPPAARLAARPPERAAAASDLWRWGAEFRGLAVLADLQWRFRVRDRVLEALWPVSASRDEFYASFDLSCFAPGGDWRRFKRGKGGAFVVSGVVRRADWHVDQIDRVLRAAIEREDRLPEILVQCDDFWSFFEWIAGLDAAPRPLAVEVLMLAWQWATPLVMALKHQVAGLRPWQQSSRVLPVIPTPPHGTLPSGHATMAALTSELLAALLPDGAGGVRARQLDRLARRIAFNRVVAGVHFPADSAAGYALGLQLASHFIGLATGRAPCPTYVFEPGRYERLGEIGTRPPLRVAEGPPPVSRPLQQLWDAAVRERG